MSTCVYAAGMGECPICKADVQLHNDWQKGYCQGLRNGYQRAESAEKRLAAYNIHGFADADAVIDKYLEVLAHNVLLRHSHAAIFRAACYACHNAANGFGEPAQYIAGEWAHPSESFKSGRFTCLANRYRKIYESVGA